MFSANLSHIFSYSCIPQRVALKPHGKNAIKTQGVNTADQLKPFQEWYSISVAPSMRQNAVWVATPPLYWGHFQFWSESQSSLQFASGTKVDSYRILNNSEPGSKRLLSLPPSPFETPLWDLEQSYQWRVQKRAQTPFIFSSSMMLL